MLTEIDFDQCRHLVSADCSRGPELNIVSEDLGLPLK